MNRFANRLALAALGSAFILTGCIHHSETVSSSEPERLKIEFQNEKAGRIFYEALSKMPYHATSESTTEVSIPVVFEHKYVVKSGDNAKFNDGVKRCDTNKDGVITEGEAEIFASQYH